MNLLRMSINGSILVVIIIIIRAVAMNKLPKNLFIIFWSLAAFLFIVPVSLNFSFNLYSIAANLGSQVSQTTFSLPALSGWDLFFNNPETSLLQNELSAVSPEINPFFLIWLIGFLTVLFLSIVSYCKSLREFKLSLPAKCDFFIKWPENHGLEKPFEIRISDKTKTPVVYGIFKPVILLPKFLDMQKEDQLNYILYHEYIHIRKCDLIKKLILTCLVCIHWFNPLAWAMYILANRDIELACDEEVINLLGEKHASDYALTLISMAEKNSQIAISYSGFSKYAIKERVLSIMNLKNKPYFFNILISILIVVGFSFLLITTANYKTELPPTLSKEETLPYHISELWGKRNGSHSYIATYFNNNTNELYCTVMPWMSSQSKDKKFVDFMAEIEDLGFLLKENSSNEIRMIRLNFGDWISEEQFIASNPGVNFASFSHVLEKTFERSIAL